MGQAVTPWWCGLETTRRLMVGPMEVQAERGPLSQCTRAHGVERRSLKRWEWNNPIPSTITLWGRNRAQICQCFGLGEYKHLESVSWRPYKVYLKAGRKSPVG